MTANRERVLAVDPTMPKLSFAGRRRNSRPASRGFAGLDRACQTGRAWHRIDGLDCPSLPEYGMAETKPLSGAGFFHQMSVICKRRRHRT